MYTYKYVCMYTYMYTHVCVCVCMYIYVYVYVCICIYMCVYICIYVYSEYVFLYIEGKEKGGSLSQHAVVAQSDTAEGESVIEFAP
jgi:hypothetical protein